MSDVPTRQRLITAATTLFAEHGFRGAAVRDICNQARVNPAAVSYHFGGKRQLYRAVLRAVVEKLAQTVTQTADDSVKPNIGSAFVTLERAIRNHPEPARLILRDLADGGQMALEALAPVLRNLQTTVADSIAASEGPASHREVNRAILRLASPIVCVTAAWPVLMKALQLDDEDRDGLIRESAASLTRPD